MSIVSRGFQGRRREGPPDRVPPGQYLTDDFPVLSAGPTPHTPLEEWTFAIRGGAEPVSWTWDELHALPNETITTDIHCVTRWSKLDTAWEGVAVDTLLEAVDHDAAYALAFCDESGKLRYQTPTYPSSLGCRPPLDPVVRLRQGPLHVVQRPVYQANEFQQVHHAE